MSDYMVSFGMLLEGCTDDLDGQRAVYYMYMLIYKWKI
jgi:hypothetical protein